MLIWMVSLFVMSPIAFLSKLLPTSEGKVFLIYQAIMQIQYNSILFSPFSTHPGHKKKCREVWPNESYEKLFNFSLNFLLLIFPLIILSVTYTFISRTLWRTMTNEKELIRQASGYYLMTFHVCFVCCLIFLLITKFPSSFIRLQFIPMFPHVEETTSRFKNIATCHRRNFF